MLIKIVFSLKVTSIKSNCQSLSCLEAATSYVYSLPYYYKPYYYLRAEFCYFVFQWKEIFKNLNHLMFLFSINIFIDRIYISKIYFRFYWLVRNGVTLFYLAIPQCILYKTKQYGLPWWLRR